MAIDPTTGLELDPYVAWAMSQGTTPPPRLPDPIPYDEEQAKYDSAGDAPGWHNEAPPGVQQFPWSPELPAPGPRTDAARIGRAGVPVQDEIAMGAAGATELSPDEAAQIEIDQPAPLQPDATTGADFAPGVGDIIGDVSYEQAVDPQYASPDAYLQHQTELAGGQPLPSTRENMVNDATTVAVNAMSPEQYVQYKSNRESAMLAKQAELEHKAAADNEQRAREDLEIQRASVAKADADTQALIADATKLANTKVNPDRYKDNRGVFGTIRDVASVFLTGLGGNAELGLRQLDQRIERDIAAQNADIANGWQGINTRKGAIGDELQRHGDLYRAQETYRIASYQGAINDVQSQLQMYDPAGATAIRGRDALGKLQAAQADALAAFNQQQFKNNVEATRLAIDIGKLRLDEQKAADARAAKLLAAGAAKKIKPDDVIVSADQLEHDYGMRPPRDMSQNGYEQWAKTGKVVEEYSKGKRENSPEERNRELGAGEIVYDDGTAVQFRDAGWGGKFANSKGAADNAIRLIDKLIARRKKTGWESDWVSSGNKREADGDFAALQLEKKNTDELGVLAGPDLGLINKSLGTSDPTEWRDSVLPGLLNARSNIIEQVNAKLRGQIVVPKGKRLQRWDPKAQDYPETAPLVRGKTSTEQGEGAKLGSVGEAFSFTSNQARALEAENNAQGGPTGLTASDDKRVTAAIKEAQGKTPGAANALQRLVDVASSSREAVRASVLTRIQGEAPELYDQVVAKLPKEVVADLPAKPEKGVQVGSPKFRFDSLDVGELAGAVSDDEQLMKVVVQKATNGKPAEKTKALEILKRRYSGGDQ